MYSNKLEKYLDKKSDNFTKKDIIKFFVENDFKMMNFRYVGSDGRLKALTFVISSEYQLDEILSCGERLDGSSLFKYIEAASSDLYVVPKYKTAFVNPFTEEPTLEIICNYYNNDGSPLASSPDNLMRNARNTLVEKTGYDLHVMGELEFYIIGESDDIYQATDQKGYHESTPYAKFRHIVEEAMCMMAEVGAGIKYGHSEVGNFRKGNTIYEQYEIEFQPKDMEEAANELIIAKWILRNLGHQYGVTISFAPKITVGKAGSGLHIHTKLVKDGKNMMVENGKLSELAKRVIAGYLYLAPSLTAFGNTNPTSYLRLVPHQEAPTNICWGDRNRSVLVRVPLGWLGAATNMIKDVNPHDDSELKDHSGKQTVEFRCPDGSANIYLLLAGLAVAARYGLEMDNALEFSEKNYVDVNIFKDENKKICRKLKQLPASCFDSATALLEQANVFTQYEIFSQGMIEDYAASLKAFDDKGLSEKMFGKQDEIKLLVDQFIHCA